MKRRGSKDFHTSSSKAEYDRLAYVVPAAAFAGGLAVGALLLAVLLRLAAG